MVLACNQIYTTYTHGKHNSERSPYNNNIYIIYIIIAWAGSESNLYECVSGISETKNETENEIQLIIYKRFQQMRSTNYLFYFLGPITNLI